jgi:hypothetical protein
MARTWTLLSKRTFDFGTVPSGTSERVIATNDSSLRGVRWGTLLLRLHDNDIASGGSFLDVWLESIDRRPGAQFLNSIPVGAVRLTVLSGAGVYPARLRLPAGPAVRLVVDGFRQGSGAVSADISAELVVR